MRLPHLCRASVLVTIVSALALAAAHAQAPFDISPFARRCCVEDLYTSQLEFDYQEARRAGAETEKAVDGKYIYGLQWAEERDISEVRVQFRTGSQPQNAAIEYWFRNWPYPPPHMPTIEDPVDDPWQGEWLKAGTQSDCRGATCTYTFAPLAPSENRLAENLPRLKYRRTLKLRLVFQSEPTLEKVMVFSGSTGKRIEVRIQLGAGETATHTWDGSLRVYNGRLENVRAWNPAEGDVAGLKHFHIVTGGSPTGLVVGLMAAAPSLPGSNDTTVVTLRSGDRSFSFATPDLQKGPIYLPDFHAYVTLQSDAEPFSPEVVNKGKKIREELAKEPEQTYERARSEIPALDPAHREGERLYLALAADASWQKFAFEWGGNIHVSKQGTKAKGRELKRLEWEGDRIAWRIGTGASPNYRPEANDSTLSVLDDYLPVATAKWTTDGIEYTEEGFATLLSGPLGPDDSARSEETPAILMLKLTAQNTGSGAATAHVWLAVSPAEKPAYENNELRADDCRRCGPHRSGEALPLSLRHACRSHCDSTSPNGLDTNPLIAVSGLVAEQVSRSIQVIDSGLDVSIVVVVCERYAAAGTKKLKPRTGRYGDIHEFALAYQARFVVIKQLRLGVGRVNVVLIDDPVEMACVSSKSSRLAESATCNKHLPVQSVI